jgi:two-component system chemotaxis response regulator CheB
MAQKIKVLVVDDSAYARTVLSRRLIADPDIEVAGFAADGIEAVEKVAALRPDVVTLDIVMPRMDGLGALERIMKDSPTAVVMVSALTREGADVTVRALELGAVDFLLKPMRGGVSAVHEVTDDLCSKVKTAATAKVPRPATARRAAVPRDQHPTRSHSAWQRKVVVIGSSTGGPQALRVLLTSLPPDMAVPILVVQHMPAGFTRSLAERLNDLGPLPVKEARAGSRLQNGRVLIAPGGFHMVTNGDGEVQLTSGPPECGVRPSVNVTIESVVAAYAADTVGVVLTGMGSDGTRGAGLIKSAGGQVIVQDESTCVVYGMPKSAAEAGYADRIVPLPHIARELVRVCRARPSHEEGRTWTRGNTRTSNTRSASP